MRRYIGLLVVLASTVSFLAGVALSTMSQTPAKAAAAASAGSPVDFADVASRVNASVVNIEAASRSGAGRWRRSLDEPDDRPRELDRPQQGTGSGFVIDRQGFILTNYHVIQDADRLTVTLADGRTLRADVVGTDPAIDVALIKVSGTGPLEAAPLGNSDELRVGEWVCAIGNPLGYVHSVTVGVVSFIGRKLFDASLDDYIQTDAAINFGNSGGPLINARGQVIGINSALSSRASNIGFAVPINQAIAILPQLKARGRVSRGFIGVVLTDVTPDLQRSLNLSVGRGALVQDVSAGSPAERAGIKPYDVIVTVDGRDVVSNDELIRDISGRQPETTARLEILRDGKRQVTEITLIERPRDLGGAETGPPSRRAPPEIAGDVPLGLTVRDLESALVRRLEIPASVTGVIVVRADPVGASFVPPIRRGFVIMEINRRPVRSVADFARLIGAARRGDTLAFYGYDPTVGQRAIVLATVDAR